MKVYLLSEDNGEGIMQPVSPHWSPGAAKQAAQDARPGTELDWTMNTDLDIYETRTPGGYRLEIEEYEMAVPWEIPAVMRQPGMNDYEYACEQFNMVAENYQKMIDEASRLREAAEKAYNDAEANLRKYESQPGIAKPEYRR